MALRFAYLAMFRVFGWLALHARSDCAKDAEILIFGLANQQAAVAAIPVPGKPEGA